MVTLPAFNPSHYCTTICYKLKTIKIVIKLIYDCCIPSWVIEWATQILEWASNFLCYVYAMKTKILKMINAFENALVANQGSFCHRLI